MCCEFQKHICTIQCNRIFSAVCEVPAQLKNGNFRLIDSIVTIHKGVIYSQIEYSCTKGYELPSHANNLFDCHFNRGWLPLETPVCLKSLLLCLILFLAVQSFFGYMTNQIYVKTFKRPYHKKLFKIENNEIYLFYSN